MNSFLEIDRGVYAKSYIGDRDIVDLERCCRLIPDELLAAKLQPLAHKIRIPGLTPLVKEIEWSANGSVGTYKPTRCENTYSYAKTEILLKHVYEVNNEKILFLRNPLSNPCATLQERRVH